MFRLIVDGEVVETLMYDNDDIYSVKRYVKDNYKDFGINPKIERVK